MASVSFKAFLKNQFGHIFKSASKNYLTHEAPRIYNIRGTLHSIYVAIEDFDIQRVQVEWSPSNVYRFFVIGDVSSSAIWQTDPYFQHKSTSTDYLAFLGRIALNGNNTRIVLDSIWASNYQEKAPFRYSLDDTLTPDTRDKNFQKWADLILSRCVPWYAKEEYLTATNLASYLGLTINSENYLSHDKSIRAHISFYDMMVPAYSYNGGYYNLECQANTIVVDKRFAYPDTDSNSYNTLLFHECVHWVVHRPAISFRNLINGNTDPYTCMEDGIQDDSRWLMEWQAREIASVLQFPQKTLKENISSMLSSGMSYKSILENLAKGYEASIPAVKIRMDKLGYPVRGYYNCNNGHLSPDLFIPAGTLENNEVYQVSLDDVLDCYCQDSKFREIINSHKFKYVDDVFVINSSRCIIREETGEHLSQYAKGHLSECCLKFKKKAINDNTVYYDMGSYLGLDNRRKRKATAISFVDKPQDSQFFYDFQQESSALQEEIEELGFCCFIKKRVTELGETCDTLSDKLWKAGSRKISAILNGKGKSDLSIVSMTKLCVALRLPMLASKALFSKVKVVHWPEEGKDDLEILCYGILQFATIVDYSHVKRVFLDLESKQEKASRSTSNNIVSNF